MTIKLEKVEARVLGCLMEKAVITPDQYPLTLNALTNACNQKSSRAPVMSLSSGEVLHGIRSLQDKRLVVIDENFKSQTEKYTHRLCNTPFSDYQFDPAQYAVVCVLLLRGPRTPGEIRANSGRLHTFSDNAAVSETLDSLLHYDPNPVVKELPRTPGRKDAEFASTFTDIEPSDTLPRSPQIPPKPTSPEAALDLEARVKQLETEVATLKRLIYSGAIEKNSNNGDGS